MLICYLVYCQLSGAKLGAFFDKLSGRCMRSVRGPALLCLDGFILPNQIASQALLECNSKYAAGQK